MSVNIDFYCNKCGTSLLIYRTVSNYHGGMSVNIEPCPICTDAMQNEINDLKAQYEELQEIIDNRDESIC